MTIAQTRGYASAHSDRTDDAFLSFYLDNYERVFHYVLLLTRNLEDAEDVTADTFERAWRAWSRGDMRPETAVSWLLVTARHRATDRWRRARNAMWRRRLRDQSNDGLRESESWLWLDAVLRLLPARQREVLALRYQEDLSDADVGLVMGLTTSGVRSLAARALATLRRHREVWD